MLTERWLDIVEAAMEAKGWTKADLAHALGCTPAVVGAHMTGDHTPRLSTLDKYATALGIVVDLTVEVAAPKPKKKVAKKVGKKGTKA